MKASHLPEHMLKCIDPAERKKLKLHTAQEAITAAEIKSEKDLQKQIVALLRLKGVEPIVSRMDKRTSNNLGTPDILFAIRRERMGFYFASPNCWEVKLPNRKLKPEQMRMMKRLTQLPNDWRHRVIYSVDQALEELRAMGL